jgi:hypothetical protein
MKVSRATNYASGINRQAKRHVERWVVLAIYADARLNVEYAYRTERGAKGQVAHLERMIHIDATRSLGGEIPMVGVTIT